MDPTIRTLAAVVVLGRRGVVVVVVVVDVAIFGAIVVDVAGVLLAAFVNVEAACRRVLPAAARG